MSAPAFTLGPWRLGRQRKYRVEIDAPNATLKWPDLARVVTHVKDGDRRIDAEGFANAHLIAAAPELYEALASLARDADKWSGNIEPPPPSLAAAWAALIKARGEQ